MQPPKQNKKDQERHKRFLNQYGVNMETTFDQFENPNPNTGPQPDMHEKKGEANNEEQKEGENFFTIGLTHITNLLSGTVGFAKEMGATAYDALVNFFKEVGQNIEEKGFTKWFADGFRKNAYGFLKLSLKVAAFMLVHNLILNATSFSILNPWFLLAVLVITVGLSIYSSYKTQKETLDTTSGKTTGYQVMSEMIAS